MVDVVAAWIYDKDKFLIYRCPANKTRGLLWEFVGGKAEAGETKEQALIHECQEQLAIIVKPHDIFTEVTHEYPDMTMHLTVFNCAVLRGKSQHLEHNDIKQITSADIPSYEF